MNFREALERITSRVAGSFGAVIIGEDGIIVERHVVKPDVDVELASVEFVGGTRDLRRATADLKGGDLEELTVVTPKMATLMRRVGRGYYLVLMMDPGGVLGRGRFELMRAGHALANEFA